MIRRISNISVPKVLYKYRSWENKNHVRLITHQEVYLSNPSEFNDPFDSNIPVRWDLMTYEDCLNNNLNLLKFFPNKISESQMRLIAKKITDEKKLWHPDLVKRETKGQISKWHSVIGLLSLSENQDNILMWSHYASNHTGFVVGFDTAQLVNNHDFDYIEPVNYQKEYPVIKSSDDTNEQFYKKFFYKSDLWKYENEWRISKNHIENRVIKLNKEAITSITIGCAASKKTIEEIINVAKGTFGNAVNIYISRKDENDFSLQIDELK